jgi:hypothetical protein
MVVTPPCGSQLLAKAQRGVKECRQVADSTSLFALSAQPVDNFVGNLPKSTLTA